MNLEPEMLEEKNIAEKLMDLISNGDIMTFSKFLSNDKLFNPRILLIKDKTNFSPLILALMDDSCIFSDKISEHMLLQPEESFKLIDHITKIDIESFLTILKLPPFENMSETDYFEYLKDKILNKFYTLRVIELIEKELVLSMEVNLKNRIL